jgi:ABC-type spermidine/putrescine transport system permease subunit II
MNNFIINTLKLLGIVIIVVVTGIVGISFAATSGVLAGLLASVVAFIVTSLPMSMFLVLCSINDKLDIIIREFRE